MKIRHILLLLPLFMLMACPPPTNLDGLTASVLSVENGNTITLSNGLIVRLIGIQDTPSAQNYLNTYLQGKTVELHVNNGDEQTVSSLDGTEVYAYVNTGNSAVNGEMLIKGFAKLDFDYLTDSLDAYKHYVPHDDCIELSFEELFTKYAPATFTIKTDSSLGTGFFINSDGLAISNAHVLNSKKDLSKVYCYLWDSKGEVAEHRFRTINRIVKEKFEGQVGKDDWVIFYVKKDEEQEKFSFFDLNKQEIRQGQKIAVLGTPQGKYGNLTEGIINNIEDDLITVSADLNGGNSGGPVFNTCGNVIGIASWAGFMERSKLNYAFNIQAIRNVLDNEMSDVYYGGK